MSTHFDQAGSDHNHRRATGGPTNRRLDRHETVTDPDPRETPKQRPRNTFDFYFLITRAQCKSQERAKNKK